MPALVAWTGTALGLSRPPATVLAVAGGLTLLCLLLIHRRWRRLPWSGLLAVTLSGTALCLLSLGAQTAVREAGLVPRLAQERATVTLEAVVITDPRVVATTGPTSTEMVLVRLDVRLGVRSRAAEPGAHPGARLRRRLLEGRALARDRAHQRAARRRRRR